jgi:hypothetical protein
VKPDIGHTLEEEPSAKLAWNKEFKFPPLSMIAKATDSELATIVDPALFIMLAVGRF